MKITFKKLILMILVLWGMNISSAHAFFYSYGEKIEPILDLPNSEEYTSFDGGYVDIGYLYTEFSILEVPLWNFNGRLIGTVGRDDEYLDMTEANVNLIVSLSGLSLPPKPYLSFWQRIGGKLVFAAFILGVIFYYMKKRMRPPYYSSKPTMKERLKDILSQKQWVEIDKSSIEEGQKGIDFIYGGELNEFYFTSIILVDMQQTSVSELLENSELLFDRLMAMKKEHEYKGTSSIFYVYCLFENPPSQLELKQLKKAHKKRILKRSNLIFCAMDAKNKCFGPLPLGITPSKKELEACFVHSAEIKNPGIKSSEKESTEIES